MHEKILWHATDVSEKKEIKKHFWRKIDDNSSSKFIFKNYGIY